MSKKANNLSYTDIIDNISKKLEKPIFLYEELPTFEDLYNNVKKHPFNCKRVVDCLSLFFILTGVYFWIIEKYFKFSFYHLLIIPVLFLISIFLTIKNVKKSISKIVSIANAKFYFYDNFLIIKSEDNIERIPYNKILFIKEGKINFAFAIKSRSFIIEKSKIDDKFYKFLKNLSKQYKSIQISSDDNLFWDCLHKYTEKPKIYCVNEKDKKNLDKYYDTKKVYKIFYICILCINFIVVLGIFSIFDIYFSNFIEFIFYMIFIIILTFFCMPNHIKYRIKRILETKQENLYFYDEFLLIKTEEKIFKCNYDNIKSVIENENLLFIKVKSILSPLIINKQSFKSKEYNLLNKIKASIK